MPDIVMSTDVQGLTQSHLEHLLNSGISVDIIKQRGYRSIFGRADPEMVAAGFTKSQISAPGILIPLHHPDGNIGGYQYRPDVPKTDNKHKPIKYVSPPSSNNGTGNILDFPVGCIDMIGDPSIPILFTEGAKKADAAVSHGLCCVNVNGVWGWIGKNKYGAKVVNETDLHYIATEGRQGILAFDADLATNKNVRLALYRFAEILKRKKCNVEFCILPNDEIGDKIGIDDYLGVGHTVEDLFDLVTDEIPEFVEPPQEFIDTISYDYRVVDGRICWYHQKYRDSKYVFDPLCNFTAKITEKLVLDDGLDIQVYFLIEGQLYNGSKLKSIRVAINDFNSMNWILEKWGGDARPSPGNGLLPHLREAILMTAEGKEPRVILGHTGWRKIGEQRVFAMPGNTIGSAGTEVSLGGMEGPAGTEDEGKMDGYRFPEDLSVVPAAEAMNCSLSFLNISRPEVTYPLWAIMYSAPLCEVIKHDFILWYLAHTGARKSTIQAQALCHYGEFDYDSLPISWLAGSTLKGIKFSLSILKNVVACIDNWAPGGSVHEQQQLENMAAKICHLVGDQAKQTKMDGPSMLAKTLRPRGAVISSGEQLPSGESNTARLFVVDVFPDDIDLAKIRKHKKDRGIYSYAMAHYIQWLANGWDRISSEIEILRDGWEEKLLEGAAHPRLSKTIATLYTGIHLGTQYAMECQAIDAVLAQDIRDNGWYTLVQLSAKHSTTVNDERPGNRFLEGLKTIYSQGWMVFLPIDSEPPDKTVLPPRFKAGWFDDEYFYLIPGIVFAQVREHLNKISPFTHKPKAVWSDMSYLGYIHCSDKERYRTKQQIGKYPYHHQEWVVPIKKSTLVAQDD